MILLRTYNRTAMMWLQWSAISWVIGGQQAVDSKPWKWFLGAFPITSPVWSAGNLAFFPHENNSETTAPKVLVFQNLFPTIWFSLIWGFHGYPGIPIWPILRHHIPRPVWNILETQNLIVVWGCTPRDQIGTGQSPLSPLFLVNHGQIRV